ncbi:hypothetical protein HK102_008667, partial [Quaeritorhiza haematococci]
MFMRTCTDFKGDAWKLTNRNGVNVFSHCLDRRSLDLREREEGGIVSWQDPLEAEADEETIDLGDLFDALSAPVEKAPLVGPASQTARKLDPDYLHRLKLTFVDQQQRDAEEYERLRESASLKLKKVQPTLQDVTEVIHVNALAGRTKEAQEAFGMLAGLGLTPDVHAYNALMDAYARGKDMDMVKKIFKTLRTGGKDLEVHKDGTLAPSVVSYSIFIKCCADLGKRYLAFQAIKDMELMGLKPNQLIYTTLIRTCLKVGDVKRAWSLFNYMRTEISSPDAVTYSLMIHACAYTKDAERALDLFKEMTERNLSPTEITFTSLVQACGSRTDYYAEAFRLLEQMAGEGFRPTLNTYHVLLQSCATHGDVYRARLIWNDLVERNADGEGGLVPTTKTFGLMFKVYSHAMKLQTKSDKSVSKKKRKAAEGAETSSESTSVVPSVQESNPWLLTGSSMDARIMLEEVEKLWTLLQNITSGAKPNQDSSPNNTAS